MNEELISVIVPVYNVEKYLNECIISIINQDYKYLEILLIDDGSTDKSGRLCDCWSKKDNRIIVIHKKNGGLSSARNFGIEKSKGKYITFIDSDDYIMPNYISYLYENIKKYKADISIGNIYMNFKDKLPHNLKDKNIILDKKNILEKMLYGGPYYISVCAKLFKRSLFDHLLFPVGKIHEDVGIIYKIYDNSHKIICGNKYIYNYRIRNNSITNSDYTENDLDLIEVTDDMCKYLKKYPELNKAIGRREIYSRISILCKKNVPKNIRCEMINFVKKNKNKILNSKSSFKDKISVILIMINIHIFNITWYIYCKLTNRIR